MVFFIFDQLQFVIGFFVGLFLFYKGFGWMREKNIIQNIPTSKIRSIAMGLVEVFGSVVPGEKLLKSPLSDKECVYYKYIIQEYRNSGKNMHWITVAEGDRGARFYLKDDTGRVLVEPKGANIDIPSDFEFNSGWGRNPSSSIKKFLEKQNLGFGGFRQRRYREYFIAPKDNLYIMGTAGDNPLVKEGTGKRNADDIMIQKGEYEKFYYISDKPEKGVLKSLKWKAIGGIFGGGALSALCLATILLYFGII